MQVEKLLGQPLLIWNVLFWNLSKAIGHIMYAHACITETYGRDFGSASIVLHMRRSKAAG